MKLVQLEQIAEIIFPDLNIKHEKIIYIDPVNGDNTAATFAKSTNNFRTPYRTFNSANGACQDPYTTIIMLPGVYPDSMRVSNGVNVYAMPGVEITGGFTVSDDNAVVNIYGHGRFVGGSGVSPLSVTGNNTIVNFEFDEINVSKTYGIVHDADGELYVRGNSIFCGNPMRIQLGTKKVRIDIRDYIKAYNSEGCIFGKDTSAPYPAMVGEIIVNCPIIETTSNSAYRSTISFHEGLKGSNGDDYKIVINAKEIRQSTAAMVDPSWPYYSSCVLIGAGDNIHIYGNLIGNNCHCVSNFGGGATPHYGTVHFYGNMESNREVISAGQKVLNGNGWHNVVVNNGYLKTEGNGASGGLIETTSNWNSIHGGTPGSMYFKNCTLYNKATDSSIFQLNQPWGINNANLYNCELFTEGSLGFAGTSSQTSKTINYHNVRSNKDNDTMIANGYSGGTTFVFDTNLTIPK